MFKEMFAAVVVAALGVSSAFANQDTVRIGVLSDMSGPLADYDGMGDVYGAELAVEDMGGEVLGKKIEIISADTQNKPDIGAGLAREWFDRKGVDVVAGGSTSAVGLAIQNVAREKRKIYLITDPGSTDFTGKQCSPYGFHFSYDTYALSKGTVQAVLDKGNKSWYFITVDYAFGHSLESDATKMIKEAGGKVVGSVRFPLGTVDFSSFLLQAQGSKAQAVAFASAGADTVNVLRQAAEFGLPQGGQQLAGLLVLLPDVEALGLEAAQGLIATESFYWDLDDETRKWTERFRRKAKGKYPTMTHAGAYSATLHYLKSVEKAGTLDTDAVAKMMRATPVNDFFNKDVAIREDGRVLNTMYLLRVKTPAESVSPADAYEVLGTIEGSEAFRPLSESDCPLVTASSGK